MTDEFRSFAIPEGARPEFAEKIHDLPCMLTISEPAPVSYRPDLPMLRNGYVTFGTFNRIEKISNEVLPVWSRLLRELPGSKLVIKHNALDDAVLRDGLVARFVEQGVGPDNVVCLGASPREGHLAEYAHIDISLDPFQQNGGAGTWESLHMGVPVIAKLGQTTSGRAAGGILKAIGLDDWVTEDDEAYIAIAKRFAADPAGLAALRQELPARIEASAASKARPTRATWKRPTASSGGTIARHRPSDSTAWPEPFRGWPKAKGRPKAAIASQTGPFSRDQRISEVPELVITTGLPALITWVDWAVWL